MSKKKDRDHENEPLIPAQIWKICRPYPDFAPLDSFWVFLQTDQEKVVPITIGDFEGRALVLATQDMPPVRPLPHNLLQNLIEKVKGEVHQLVIHTLAEDVFHAYLLVQTPDEVFYLDCRPSDGMIVANLMNVPIYLSPEVVAAAGRDPSSLAENNEGELEITNKPQEGLFSDPEKDITAASESLADGPPEIVETTPEIIDTQDDGLPLVEHTSDHEPKAESYRGRSGLEREANELEKLETQLERLVAEELYEEAAKIRDHISLIRSRQ